MQQLILPYLHSLLPPSLTAEVGDPPQITSQPQDVVVFDQDTMLSSEVIGTPVPTIRWFRGSTDLAGDERYVVFENGSLLLANITEGVHASRDGLPYYCQATNLIGPDNVAATIRSRTANVMLACEFFYELCIVMKRVGFVTWFCYLVV